MHLGGGSAGGRAALVAAAGGGGTSHLNRADDYVRLVLSSVIRGRLPQFPTACMRAAACAITRGVFYHKPSEARFPRGI